MAVGIPLFLNGVDYNAESERRGLSGLVAQTSAGAARTGVLGPVPDVSLSGSTVKVGAFNAVIGSAKGAYLVAVDGVTDAEGSVVPADATNPRLDRVVLEVLDPDNGTTGTTLRKGRLRVITGQAAALPSLPALPPLAMHVAQIQVPRSVNGAAVTPVRTVDCPLTAAAGAPIPVRSAAERDSIAPIPGVQAFRMDTRSNDFTLDGRWVDGVLPVGGSAGWALYGAIQRTAVGDSIRNQLTLKLQRTSPTLNWGASDNQYIQVTSPVVPAAARPSDVVDVPVTYVAGDKTWAGLAVIRIELTGALSLMPVIPSTLVVSQNGYFTVNAEWLT